MRQDIKCPHCQNYIHPTFANVRINPPTPYPVNSWWICRIEVCPKCIKETFSIHKTTGDGILESFKAYPPFSDRGPAPEEVPKNIKNVYEEACNCLDISAKASAALSRRCLQHILNKQGYKKTDLAKQIDAVLGETDSKKSLPSSLYDQIDAIRNFGNFSAHPIDDKTTLQIIDVEEGEAEWCLEIIEGLFDHYYVKPAIAKAKIKNLNDKLESAGKPPKK